MSQVETLWVRCRTEGGEEGWLKVQRLLGREHSQLHATASPVVLDRWEEPGTPPAPEAVWVKIQDEPDEDGTETEWWLKVRRVVPGRWRDDPEELPSRKRSSSPTGAVKLKIGEPSRHEPPEASALVWRILVGDETLQKGVDYGERQEAEAESLRRHILRVARPQ